MKLLTRTSIYYLVFAFLLFFAGGMLFYIQLRAIIDEDITENLYREKDQVLQFASDSTKILQPSISFGDRISFSKETVTVKEQLQDTLIFNPLEEEYQPYKRLTFPARIGEQNYSVTLSKSMFESEDLFDTIVFSLGIMAVIMLILLLLLTRLLSKQMWKPFYTTLEVLQRFDVNKKEAIGLSHVNIHEFNMLNKEIQNMTDRIQRDYQNLKEFTENASHEIQTPLAIIRSKLEWMLQQENLPEEQIKLIHDVYGSVNRLSKLHQSLLLLTKIENRQFHELQPVDLKNLIEDRLDQVEEMIAYKNIRVEKELNASPEITMNPYLADILLSNLIGNAIKHNHPNGEIRIELDTRSVMISNTGSPLEIPAEKLFQRFQKSDPSSDSAGLGLSIVKRVHFKVPS